MKPSTFAYLGAFCFFALGLLAWVTGQSISMYTSAMMLALILARGYEYEEEQ